MPELARRSRALPPPVFRRVDDRPFPVQRLGLCNITKCCTEVCPEHIKITDNAIIPMKERVAGRRFDPLVWLGSKISRRPEPAGTPAVPGKR